MLGSSSLCSAVFRIGVIIPASYVSAFRISWLGRSSVFSSSKSGRKSPVIVSGNGRRGWINWAIKPSSSCAHAVFLSLNARLLLPLVTSLCKEFRVIHLVEAVVVMKKKLSRGRSTAPLDSENGRRATKPAAVTFVCLGHSVELVILQFPKLSTKQL